MIQSFQLPITTKTWLMTPVEAWQRSAQRVNTAAEEQRPSDRSEASQPQVASIFTAAIVAWRSGLRPLHSKPEVPGSAGFRVNRPTGSKDGAEAV